jgi:hypothetical protein
MSSPFIVFSIDEANALLRSFVMAVLDLPDDHVLIETRMRPRPMDTQPYATLYWKEQELLNQFDADMDYVGTDEPDEDKKPDPHFPDGMETRENPAHCTVRITVRGDNAYNLCSELRYALESANRNFDLWTVLGFAGCTSVTDLSAAYGAQTQQRSFIELSFYAPFGRRYNLDWFNAVPFVVNNKTAVYPKEKKPCPQIP